MESGSWANRSRCDDSVLGFGYGGPVEVCSQPYLLQERYSLIPDLFHSRIRESCQSNIDAETHERPMHAVTIVLTVRII